MFGAVLTESGAVLTESGRHFGLATVITWRTHVWVTKLMDKQIFA